MTGTREASDERSLRRVLRDEGLIAVEVRPERLSDALRARFDRGRVRGGDGAWVFSTLALLLENRVPVDEAVRSAESVSPHPRVAGVCARLREQLRRGVALSDALASVPGLASAQHVALIRAGESSGRLSHAVGLVDRSIANAARVRRSLIGKLTYPAILVVASVGAVWLLATRIVPSFAETLEEVGGELPAVTKVTLTASAWLAWVVPAIVVLVVVGALVRNRVLSAEMKRGLSARVLRIPVVGSLVWHGQAALVTDVLSTMLEGGADLLEGIARSSEVVRSPEIAARLETASARVREGGEPGAALVESGVMPPMVGAVVRAGIVGGDLAGGLRRASELAMARQEALGERLLALVQPAVTLGMAGVIGWMMYSLIAGMLAVTNAGGL